MAHPSRTRSLLGLGSALLLALGALLVPAPAFGAITQGISGTITEGGSPVEDGGVQVFDASSPSRIPVATAGIYDSGHYQLQLPTGQYWVRFVAFDAQGFAPEWYEDSPTRQGSTKVTVTTGSVLTLDSNLQAGGTITGVITQANPDPSYDDADVTVCLLDATFPNGCEAVGNVQIDGTDGRKYTIRGLPSGTYKLHFQLSYAGREGWWENATTKDAATPVPVTAPNTTTGISPVDLLPLGIISGKVTNAETGSGIGQVSVQLYHQYEDGSWDQAYGRHTTTASDGTYSIRALAGTYRIRFSAPVELGFDNEYWKDASTVENGQDVVVTPDATFPGRNESFGTFPPIANATLPQILGSARVGSQIQTTTGSWTPADPDGDFEFTRQWLRDGVPIAGAVGVFYTPTGADAGKRVAVRVTASRVGFSPLSATSLPVTIPLQSFQLLSKPAITGILKVGRMLRAVAPRTSPTATVRYQWLRAGKAIPGARAATHRLVRADRGRKIAVRITLTRAGYATLVRIAVRGTRVQ